jgi:transcriptional regulator with XRE-family HTH domain
MTPDGWDEAEIEDVEGGPPGLTLNEVIGHNLNSLRVREGLALRALAELMNRLHIPGRWSAKKLSEYENGLHRYKVDEVYLFAELYGERVLSLLRPPTHTRIPRVGTISILNYMAVRADEFEADFVFDPEHMTGSRIAPDKREGNPLMSIEWDRTQGLSFLLQKLIEQDTT